MWRQKDSNHWVPESHLSVQIGVERYESASYSIAEQITAEPERLAYWFACDLTISQSNLH